MTDLTENSLAILESLFSQIKKAKTPRQCREIASRGIQHIHRIRNAEQPPEDHNAKARNGHDSWRE